MTKSTAKGAAKFTVEVQAWCGNVKPFCARVEWTAPNGRARAQSTGFCKSEGRALAAGQTLLAKLEAQDARERAAYEAAFDAALLEAEARYTAANAGAEIPAELSGGLPRAEAPAAPVRPLTMTADEEARNRAISTEQGTLGRTFAELDATRRSHDATVGMGVAAVKELAAQRDALFAALQLCMATATWSSADAVPEAYTRALAQARAAVQRSFGVKPQATRLSLLDVAREGVEWAHHFELHLPAGQGHGHSRAGLLRFIAEAGDTIRAHGGQTVRS